MGDEICRACGYQGTVFGLGRHLSKCPFYRHELQKQSRISDVVFDNSSAKKRKFDEVDNCFADLPEVNNNMDSDDLQEIGDIAVAHEPTVIVNNAVFDDSATVVDPENASNDPYSYIDDQLAKGDFSDNVEFNNLDKGSVALKISAFAISVGLSRVETEQLLSLLRENLPVEHIPRTARTLELRRDVVISSQQLFTGDRADVVHEIIFDVSDVNSLQPTTTFSFRDPLTALITLLLKHGSGHDSGITFQHTVVTDPVTGIRCLWGDASGEWWFNLEHRYLLPGCVPLIFKIFIDGTVTLSNCHQCPIMVTLANFDAELQASTRGKVCIGYIPYVRGLVKRRGGGSAGRGAKQFARKRQEIFDKCMAAIGARLWPNGKRTVNVLFRGEVITMQVICKNLVLDGPQARQAAGIATECVRCRCPKVEFAAPLTHVAPIRTAVDMRAVFEEAEGYRVGQRHARDGTQGDCEALRQGTGKSVCLFDFNNSH
jgi:hypothetical protein